MKLVGYFYSITPFYTSKDQGKFDFSCHDPISFLILYHLNQVFLKDYMHHFFLHYLTTSFKVLLDMDVPMSKE